MAVVDRALRKLSPQQRDTIAASLRDLSPKRKPGRDSWAPYGGLWPVGFGLQVGEVFCSIKKTNDRGHHYEHATVNYTDKKGIPHELWRNFTHEEDARLWCVQEALRVQGFETEVVIQLKENRAMTKKVKGKLKDAKKLTAGKKARSIKLKTKAEPKCKVNLSVGGKTKVRGEVNQAQARALMELLRRAV